MYEPEGSSVVRNDSLYVPAGNRPSASLATTAPSTFSTTTRTAVVRVVL